MAVSARYTSGVGELVIPRHKFSKELNKEYWHSPESGGTGKLRGKAPGLCVVILPASLLPNCPFGPEPELPEDSADP